MLLVLCLSSVYMKTSSAVESPAIMIVPENTLDETLTTGKNFTISIYTDYNGNDVYMYQFTLSYNSSILHIGVNKTDTWTGAGMAQLTYNTTVKPVVEDSEKVYVNEILKTRDSQYTIDYVNGSIWFFPFAAPPFGSEVKATYQYGIVNGDLITKDKDPSAQLEVGTFDNTLGETSLTLAYFYFTETPVPTTSGPGILANVTFTVVGYGTSDITLRDQTMLFGINATTAELKEIINAEYEPDHIQHGYFSNKIPGDVDGDADVDASDLSDLSEAYGSTPSKPNWNSGCDFKRDYRVDASDLFDLSKNYGKSVP